MKSAIRACDPSPARMTAGSLPPAISSALADCLFLCSGTLLLSHAVPGIVPSAARALTVVFGMGTGVPPGRIGTGTPSLSKVYPLIAQQHDSPYFFP